MDFEPILTNTLKLEGGKTVDTGGVTNMGVTQSAFDAYAQENNIPVKSVNDLKLGDVSKFYEEKYWKQPKISELPSEKVAALVFDYGVNAGTGTAVKSLQKIVGSKSDGVIGKKTLAAVNEYIAKHGEQELAERIISDREDHYVNLVNSNPDKYGRYFNGWMNRITKLQKQYGMLDGVETSP